MKSCFGHSMSIAIVDQGNFFSRIGETVIIMLGKIVVSELTCPRNHALVLGSETIVLSFKFRISSIKREKAGKVVGVLWYLSISEKVKNLFHVVRNMSLLISREPM